MKFRRRTDPQVIGFQIAPMVDVLHVTMKKQSSTRRISTIGAI